ncbi:MAG: eukaryotic-like serine/threonine-protein kinase [Streptosporangiaceae bacterium]|jgi:hypothetical protein|nr:eukaryotic-like serine/threonine-protein kinase [Streptosporangiaceae bacterium]
MATGLGQLVAGRYRLRAQLGQGGMGVVWHAHDDLLDRDVAVKEVLCPVELNASEQQMVFRRTEREARAAARLNHPAAVTVFDVVEQDGRPWIVMEFVRCRSLAQTVEEDGPMPPSQAAQVGLQVLGALAAAHAVGILHRDVKPGNVLLAEDSRVVLTDFGIAALDGDATLTASGAVMGSPAYIAPERARGGPAEPASDLWSLGVTLYAAVEGRTPYERGGAMPTLLAVVTEEPDPPQRAGPLAPVLDGLLRRDPAHRLSADDTRRLLRVAAAGPDIAAGPDAAGAPDAAGGPDVPPPARPDLTGGGRTRVLRLPGPAPVLPSTVTSAVPPGTSQPPIPATEMPDDPRRPGDPGRKAPRRRYVALLAAFAGLVLVGLIAALLLMPGGTSSPSRRPAASPSSGSAASPSSGSASSVGSSGASSAGPASPTSPGSAGASTPAGSAAPSTAPSAAASTGGGTPPPTATAAASP